MSKNCRPWTKEKIVNLGISKLLSEPAVCPNQYCCAACGEVFDKGWTDEEAVAELAKAFPGSDKSECSMVCEGCYWMIRAL